MKDVINAYMFNSVYGLWRSICITFTI